MSEGTRVSTHFVRPLGRALAESGVDTQTFLARHGLAGEHPRRVPIESVIAAWQAAALETGDQAIGIRAARLLSAGDFGVLEYAARSSQSLRAAFERLSRYHALLNDRASLEFFSEGETTTLRYLQPGLPPAYLEFVLSSWVAIASDLPDSPFILVEALLPHPEPEDSTLQRSLFGAKLRFDAPHAELRVDRRAFEHPLARADAELGALLDRHALERLDSIAREREWSRRIAALLEVSIADGPPRLEQIAARMELSPRALRRKLDAENQTFSGLIDSTRLRLALSMVEDDSVSLGEIAFLLGFSEPSAFHRAFKRWTGRTPRAS